MRLASCLLGALALLTLADAHAHAQTFAQLAQNVRSDPRAVAKAIHREATNIKEEMQRLLERRLRDDFTRRARELERDASQIEVVSRAIFKDLGRPDPRNITRELHQVIGDCNELVKRYNTLVTDIAEAGASQEQPPRRPDPPIWFK